MAVKRYEGYRVNDRGSDELLNQKSLETGDRRRKKLIND